MKQDYCLRFATLALAENMEQGVVRDGRLTIKNTITQQYLTVSVAQRALLERFKHPQRVPDLLPQLIYDRACPSLKEFYELILQAVAVGVLDDKNAIRKPVSAVQATNWRFLLNGWCAVLLLWIGLLFTLVVAFTHSVELPTSWYYLVVGYLFSALAASLGSILAAAHLRWAGGEIYRPSFCLNLLAPHLKFDLTDCLLYPKKIQMRMALLRILPHFVLLGIVLIIQPEFSYVILTSLFLLMLPGNHAPVVEYIRTRFSQDAKSTDLDPIFNPNKVLRHLVSKHVAYLNPRYLLCRISYTIFWLVAVYFVNLKLFNINHPRLLDQALTEQGDVPILVFLALVLSIVLSASTAIVLLLRNLLSLRRSRGRRTGRNFASLSDIGIVDLDGVSKFLNQCYFIEQLELDEVAIRAIAQAGKPIRYKNLEDIVVESEEGDTFYILLSGKVRVLRTNSAGREVKCAELGSGDAFGEVALLKQGMRTRTVRALGKVIVLAIGLDDFNEIILKHAKADEVIAILQRQSFINRLPFTADWPPGAIRELGRKMQLANYFKGRKLLSCGADNRTFYIVYEGAFKVEVDGKRVGKVLPGEFIGEISLLQNSLIQADVIAFEDSQCLYLDKHEFIRFISEEFVVSLYVEKVSSKRLKYPIFPYAGKSFDIYRPIGTRR